MNISPHIGHVFHSGARYCLDIPELGRCAIGEVHQRIVAHSDLLGRNFSDSLRYAPGPSPSFTRDPFGEQLIVC